MDPVQRCAAKALAGEYGELQDWQRCAYQYVLDQGVTVPEANRAKLTSYGPWEPCGTHTYSGDRVTTAMCAVDKSQIPLGTLVWTAWGLRYAMDTGGAVKSRWPYIRRGENAVIDYYTMRGVETERAQPWVIVKRQTQWNWYGRRVWGDWTKVGMYRGQPSGLTP
jgi:hypothetical protein